MKTAISSSSEQDELDALLQISAVKDLADAVTSSSDTQHSKPAPDPILVALEKTGVAPDQALMVGDTPYDSVSASKTGVRTIALRCGGFSDDLSASFAIYDDPADLLTHFDSLSFR